MKEDVALTVDVERIYPDSENGAYDFIQLFARYGIKATFFITGDVLTACPRLVETILADGHEVGSHGHRHPGRREDASFPYLNEMSEAEAEEEIVLSKEIFIENGVEVKGFRAPAFKISRHNLKQIGRHFLYDSSASNFLIGTKKYLNIATAPCIIDGTVEIPISTFQKVRLMQASSNFSFMGARAWVWCIKGLGLSSPSVFYFHSFDTVPFSGEPLAVPKWKFKRFYYYKRCGKNKMAFLDTLFGFLHSRGCNFLRTFEIAESLSNSKKELVERTPNSSGTT